MKFFFACSICIFLSGEPTALEGILPGAGFLEEPVLAIIIKVVTTRATAINSDMCFVMRIAEVLGYEYSRKHFNN